MSSIPLWVVVEGTFHDRAYYDKLFRSISTLEKIDYEIILAEFTSVDEVAAGGKKHALSIHRELAANLQLRQSSNSIPHIVLFALDRDLDEEPPVTTPDDLHIIYTKYSDVEAEIIQNGDLTESLVATTGAALRDVKALPKKAFEPLDHLAKVWEEWIIWGLALRDVNPNPMPTRSASLINDGKFGDLDPAARALHEQRIIRVVGESDWTEKVSAARIRHASLDRQTKLPRLVPGKWASRFVIELVKEEMAAVGIPAGINELDLLRSMLNTMNFSVANKRRYATRVDLLFKECAAENAPLTPSIN